MGKDQVERFKSKWGISVQPPKPQELPIENAKPEVKWWEEDLNRHLFEKREIENPTLKSLYRQYLQEYWGAKEESDLDKVFKKDETRFTGTAEEEEQAFGKYLLDNFSDWIGNRTLVTEERKSENEKPLQKPKPRLELGVNEKRLKRLVTPEEQEKVHRFVGAWGKTERVGMRIRKGKIDSFAIAFKDSDGTEKKIFLSEILFRTALGLEPYREHPMDDATGVRFGGRFIIPQTNPELAGKILKELRIDGSELPKNSVVKMVRV